MPILFDPETMNYEMGWNYQPDKCNCDAEFIRWVKGDVFFGRIFHMGTGMHHKVGLELRERTVVGLTYSPNELLEYTELVRKDPILPSQYVVLFGDICYINLGPMKFDVITLFHLGEIMPNLTYPEQLLEFTVQDLITFNLEESGYILGYSKSAGWHIAQPILERWMEKDSEYESLVIYKRKA